MSRMFSTDVISDGILFFVRCGGVFEGKVALVQDFEISCNKINILIPTFVSFTRDMLECNQLGMVV